MKKFLFKGVSVLGAMLLFATSVMPGLQYAYAEEAPVLVYDLIYDEASWNAAYNKEGSALKEYYEDYPDEDRWCLDGTEAGGHYGRVADKVNEAWPDTCVQSWKGAVNAAGAKYPWAVINVPEGGLKGTIIFEYGDTYVGDNAKAPFGQYVTLSKEYGIESIPNAFGDDSFLIGENSQFDSSKFKIKFIPAEFTTLEENTDWFYVNNTTTFDNAKTNGKKPLDKYYRDYPGEDLWNGTERGHSVTSAVCTFTSYGDANTTIEYAQGTIQGQRSDINSENAVGVKVLTNSVVGFVNNVYYIDKPMADRGKLENENVYELFTNPELTQSAGIWAKITSCSYNPYYNAYEGAVAWGGVFPRIAIGFDSATQLKIVLKYYDNSNENNIIDKFVRLGNWNDNRDWALAVVPSVLGLDEITPAKLKVILVGDEDTAVEITKATYPTKTVSFETDGGSTVESQPVELGQKATEPETNPIKEGFAFVDWYTSEDGGQTLSNEPFDFDTPIVNNITLYAKWASTAWEMYAIHALPITEGGTQCNDMGGGNQCKANSADGTYKTADGTYTIKNSDHTLTYSDVTIKDPDAQINENGERPSGYVRFGVRFLYPEAITDNATFKGNNFCDGDNCYFKKSNGYVDSRGQALSSAQLQELISNGAKTKEWEIKASWNGTEEETFKVVLDLKNVEIKDPTNKSVIKVEDYKIVSIGDKTAYTITFDTDGGSAVASISANEGDSVTAPANPTKDGYTFAGWDKTIPTVMPAENITIKAKWNKKSTGGGSSSGGGGSRKTTTTDDTKDTTTDTAKVDETKTDTDNDSETKEGNNDAAQAETYSDELVDAYEWAYGQGITTMPTIQQAKLNDSITREQLAKMMVQFMSKVLGKQPIKSDIPDYDDVKVETRGQEMTDFVTLAYQYQIMGIDANGNALKNFKPTGTVSRAEFATVLSRVLFGDTYNQNSGNYRELHIQALNTAGILNNTNPTITELRGWILLMLYRSRDVKIELKAKDAPVAEAPAEETTPAAQSDESKGEVSEGTGAMIGMPNPASVYCEEQGGTLSIVKDAEGNESGMCKLADGTEVEEWAYYRANHADEAASAQEAKPAEESSTSEETKSE